MKLIVGLGNPGDKYKNNRHNTGFQFIDYIIENRKFLISNFELLNKSQISNNKLQTEIYKLSNNKIQLILAKPLTFMNHSGIAVKKLTTTYHLQPTNLIVAHDDLDIPLGKFKIQMGIGPKLHNGIESIENHLKSKDFLRIRIGVDNRVLTGWVDGETYSLQDFRPEEKKVVDQTFPTIWDRLKKEMI